MNNSDWRWSELEKIQKHYKDFRDFYADCSEELLGFTPSDMQFDIAHYVATSSNYAMVQAQRGEAKTTITGCYAVWCLIHAPGTRVLILSAGSSMAKEISTWCIQIFNTLPMLEIMRCDKSHPGARSSVEAYDIHHDLKGPDKSPSIKCMGITSNMQGSRADLLISDDIESAKNSMTQLMREQLRHLTKDFTSINSTGKIIYLGTPQSVDSIYNALPDRGFDVRIWPGRYPTPEERDVYGVHLAPYIASRLDADPTLGEGGGMALDRGKPTDPVMMDEETLIRKEIDQGKAYFNLQFMLNTALADEERHPLKLHNLMFYNFDLEDCPGKFTWTRSESVRIPSPRGFTQKDCIYRPIRVHDEYFKYRQKIISIDPGGTSSTVGDETGISIIYECNGYMILMYNTGLMGGNTPENFQIICDLIDRFDVHTAVIERNMGAGTFAESLKGAFITHGIRCGIEEVWASTQKELRIIQALEPVISSHKLLINEPCLDNDLKSSMKFPLEKRSSYQLFFQLKSLTRDRGSLLHDDRLESLSQGVAYLKKALTADAEALILAKKQQQLEDWQKDPFGVWKNSFTNKGAIDRNLITDAFDRFNR